MIEEKFMQQAIDLAAQARQHGNHPFGALLVLDGKVVLTAENTVNSERDVTRHAELNLVSAATRQFLPEALSKMTLYTSTEPCAMCTGAIYWAGVRKVVYGCPAETLGAMATGSFVVPSRVVFAYGDKKTAVIGPVMEETAVSVHDGFWD